MNFYLISPRVDGATTDGFLETMFERHIVMMGYGTDHQIGSQFQAIEKGDFVLVALRVNWVFYYYFAGIVDDDEGFVLDGYQCRKLKHFVDLRKDHTDYLEGVSFAEMRPLKAMMAIRPYDNQRIIDRLDTIIKKQIKKENMETFIRLLQNNHNLILTGAPGTGKTYLAKQIAQQMIFGEVKNHLTDEEKKQFNEQCGFVQFHPSYDYTDFVEGLRPIEKDSTLGFERKDGVFKEFCKKALQVQLKTSFEKLYESIVEDIENSTIVSYTNLSGQENSLRVIDGHIEYGCKRGDKDFRTENIDNIKLLYEHLVKHPEDKKNSSDEIRDVMEQITNGRVKTIDSSEYLWTVEQLLFRRNQLLSQKFVFIIDEINRGEMSKIFGELFYSIDPGYRGVKGKVSTQYQNLVKEDDLFYDGFYVPENVYIIGTMNDIDRSVESMDFAMRRRFAWKEITVESRQSMLDEEEAWSPNDKPASSIIDEIKNRMNNLNACIIDQYQSDGLSSKDKIGLTKAYQIGASYFLKYGLYNNFEELWVNHLEGLLYEYLRGTTNIETKMERLKAAYNDSEAH